MGGSIMGNAGRVLMIPKGEYNSATTYQMLDFVYYQGRSYVCKQTSTGNVPTNTTYWQALTGDASAEIQALTNYVTDTGVKNLLENDAVNFTYDTGLTVTVNDNKEIIINGTSSNYTIIQVNADVKLEDGKKYILSGCPSGGSGATYKLDFNLPSGFVTDFGDSIEFTYATKSEGNNCRIVVYGGTYNNLTFKPMVREAVITDATYQPYAMNNKELTTKRVEISSSISLDDCTDEHTIYYITNAYVPINAPEADAYNSIIWVKDAGTYIIQFYTSSNKKAIYFRFRAGTSWQPWQKVTSTQLQT